MESAWQPSEELWLLARTKLVAKDFMPPSDVRAVESTRKLQEDWERRKPVMVQACPWQRHLATENRSQSTQRHLEADLRSKIIHPSIQPLVKQILNSLSSKAPDDVDIWHMSALRAAASTAHGAGSFLLGSFTLLFSNPGEKTGEAIPAEPHRSFAATNRKIQLHETPACGFGCSKKVAVAIVESNAVVFCRYGDAHSHSASHFLVDFGQLS